MIWKNIYNRDTNRKISDFIWRIIHNRIKCGAFFRMIPGWEEKQYCYRCGQMESVNHVVLRCNENHQESIWQRVDKLMKAPRKQRLGQTRHEHNTSIRSNTNERKRQN